MLNPMDGELGIGLFGMLGFVILRRVGERERASHSFCKRCWVAIGLGFFFVFSSSSAGSSCTPPTHLFRADGSGKGHAARPLPTRNAVAEGIVDGLSKHAVFDAAA